MFQRLLYGTSSEPFWSFLGPNSRLAKQTERVRIRDISTMIVKGNVDIGENVELFWKKKEKVKFSSY